MSDFELLLEHDRKGPRATVLASPAGTASSPAELGLAALDPALARLHLPPDGRRSGGPSPEHDARAAGTLLYDALLPGDVGAAYLRSLQHAEAAGEPLNLLLRGQEAALLGLPWELAYCPPLRRHLALSARTPLLRVATTARTQPSPPPEPPRSVGVAGAAAPSSEAFELLAADRRSAGAGVVRIYDVPDLVRAARDGIQVLYLRARLGRGAKGDVRVWLPFGDHADVGAPALGTILGDAGALRLVVLHPDAIELGPETRAALAEAATALVAAGVPNVLAITLPMPEDALGLLLRGLQPEEIAGRSLPDAVADLRKATSIHPFAWAAFALHTATLSSEPLFAVPRPPTGSPRPTARVTEPSPRDATRSEPAWSARGEPSRWDTPSPTNVGAGPPGTARAPRPAARGRTRPILGSLLLAASVGLALWWLLSPTSSTAPPWQPAAAPVAILLLAAAGLAASGGTLLVRWRTRGRSPGPTAPEAPPSPIYRLQRCRTVAEIAALPASSLATEVQPTSPAGRLLTVAGDIAAALSNEGLQPRRNALVAVIDRLAEEERQLRRQIRSPGGQVASRVEQELLRRVTRDWSRVVTDEVARLDVLAEEQQEIDSPYVVGTPLREQQAVFVGRRDLSQRLEALLPRDVTPALLLYGQRRMGKTSLLNNLGQLLPSTVVPMFVDLQGPPSQATGDADFLYQLARGMASSARRHRDYAFYEAPDRAAFARDPFTTFYAWLDDLHGSVGDRTGLLMLDEFEALERAFAAGRIDPDAVLGMLRHLIQHSTWLKVLLAGSHTLDTYTRWAGYLINVQVLKVGYLTPDAALDLVLRPAPGFRLRYAPGAAEHVLELTRCHPFLVQLLCAEVVALKNEQPPEMRRLATVQDVDAAAERALESGAMYFHDIEHNQLGPDALAALVAVATAPGTVPPAPARALAELLDLDLVEASANGYRCQVELTRRWFAGRH